ncbi:DNA-dependent helicase II [compost metagenome]
MTKLIPTAEQTACVGMIGENRILKIVAGAGCSKTTTLSMVANATECRSLYLAFNKAMVEEAKNKFPRWVTIKTTHGLAYGVFGTSLAHKLKRPLGRYVNVCGTGSEISRNFRIGPMHLDSGKTITAGGMGVAVKETVNRFEYSSDKEISSKHVSFAPVGTLIHDTSFSRAEYEAIVVGYARLLWNLRKDVKSPILATHDTYLKLFQLSKPDLSMYDVVYLDEAQDTNDCVLDIISNLQNKIVFVGDPRQQIYSWRGSVNAMAKFDCTQATLSTSFRFGQAVADVANMILNSTEPSELVLRGWDKLESTIGRYMDSEAPHARLYRTNAALVADGVELIVNGRKVALEIDVRDFVKVLESSIALFNGDTQNVKHENILPFPTWEDLLIEAKLAGGELSRITTLISKGEATNVLRTLANYTKPAHPEVILTTAHKSKGREFDIVVLADDFPSCYNEDGEWVGLNEMEQNLLYVAATRARNQLIYNETVAEIMSRSQKSSSGLVIKPSQVCTGEEYLLMHEHTIDKVIGDCMRAGMITNREEILDGIYMAEHEARHGDYIQEEA